MWEKRMIIPLFAAACRAWKMSAGEDGRNGAALALLQTDTQSERWSISAAARGLHAATIPANIR
jgi:hypothetical protein